MPKISSTRLPVPHLFMVLSIGVFALMSVSAFTPAAADDGGSTTAGPEPAAVDLPVAADDGPAVGALIALLALLGLLAATIRAGQAGANGSGRPILGLVAGLVAGVAGATSLSSVGAITLGSPVWIYVPLALATLGTALGTTAPIQRR